MIERRSSGSAIVPSGASSRAWSQPSARTPGRRMTSASASATAGAGATLQAPPDATTMSAAGFELRPGVASRSRPSDARTAAMRRRAPSPAASPQGTSASSRRRSRTRSRSSGIVSQPAMASRCSSLKLGGRRAAAGTEAQRAGPGFPAVPGAATEREAPVWPISTTSTRLRRTSASVAVAAARARRPSCSPPRRLSRRSRSDSPSPAVGDGPRTVGPGRSGRNSSSIRPPGAARPPASTVTRSGRRSVAAATSVSRSGSRPRSSAPGGSDAPARMALTRRSASAVATGRISTPSRTRGRTRHPAEAAAAASGPRTRAVAATTAISGGRVVVQATRGRSAAASGSVSRRTSARSGSPAAKRRIRRSTTASGSTIDGAAVAPSRRHEPRTRPTSETAVVAVPRSRAMNARGPLLTGPMLSATPPG